MSKMINTYLGGLKWVGLSQFQPFPSNHTPDPVEYYHSEFGDVWFKCYGDLNGHWGYMVFPASEPLTGERPFYMFNYFDASKEMRQFVVYGMEEEKKFFRGLFRWWDKNNHFETAEDAFKAIDQQGCPFDLVSVPQSELRKLLEYRRGHRKLGKNTSNKAKVAPYSGKDLKFQACKIGDYNNERTG